VSPSGGTFAVGALLSTSAILTFLVGVFARVADGLVVFGPGYPCTFQMSGWGWANMLTGVVLARGRTCRLHQSGSSMGCGNHRNVLGHCG
jgi:hypothetical protein